jgi:hypothetical protein
VRPTQRGGAVGQIAVLFAGADVVGLTEIATLLIIAVTSPAASQRGFPVSAPIIAVSSALLASSRAGKLFNDRLAVGKRQPRPGRERLAGSRDRLGNLPGIRRSPCQTIFRLTGSCLLKRPTTGPPFAVNPQTHAVFSSGIRRTMRTWSPA